MPHCRVEESGKVRIRLPRLPEDMPCAMGQVSADDLDVRREGLAVFAAVLIYAAPPASADICGQQLGGCAVAH